MARPFNMIRAKLVEYDMTAAELATRIGIHEATMSARMTGREQWRLDEMYAVMDLLRIPHDKLPEYFPKGGVMA